MDDLSELCFDMGGIDELYSSIDNDSTDLGGNSERPPSIMSWTFSPISDDGSYNNTQDFSFVIPEHSSCMDLKTEEQQPITDTVKIEPANHEREYKTQQQQQYVEASNRYTQSVQQITSQLNNYSEYVYPNNITYHHSVNIHNYVGNYHNPAVWWDNQSCSRLQSGYDRVSSPFVQKKCDPQVTLANHGTDFTRCSTPDYLLALNSLKQLDSPPRPNHSAAINFLHQDDSLSPQQQDSGYNSDLNVSPVIQYQDAIKLRPHQSTPNAYSSVNLANIKPSNSLFVTQPPTLSRLPTTYTPTVPMCPEDMKPEQIKEHIYKAIHNKGHPNVPKMCHKTPIMSVADYQASKRQKSSTKQGTMKRKSECDLNSTQDSKRRRHNEPLNQHALAVMTNWYVRNSDNPYPNKEEKDQLAKEGGLSIAQVKSWFANKRNRSNNTRPKKQKIEMEDKLMQICHQLARDAAKPNKDNAYYIQQLSSIIRT